MYTAFSREQKHKAYVQDLILQQSKGIALLIQNGGHVYVCGDVGMSRGVTETLCKVLTSETSISLDDAQRELSDIATFTSISGLCLVVVLISLANKVIGGCLVAHQP